MKRLSHILLLLCALCGSAFAAGELTNEINITFCGMASYAADTHVMHHPIMSYFAGMNPARTNHMQRIDNSGDVGSVYEFLEEKRCLPLWASWKVAGWNWILNNDNGGYSYSTSTQAIQQVAQSPATFFNGTADTNEAVATVPITHYPIGRLPHDSADGDSGAIAGNLAGMDMDVIYGLAPIDVWHMTWTNGLSVDVVGNRLLGYVTGSHPYLSGFLQADIYILTAMGYPTNIGSLTFDYNNATAYTNFCAATGVSLSGNTLTATVRFDRMPMAWDVPDGTITNDARAAFVADTSLGNRMRWTLQVTNLPAGNYNVGIDGSNVVQLTDAQLSAPGGWNMFTNYNGAPWAQRKEVLGRIRDKEGEDRVTLISHSAGNGGLLGSDVVNYDSNGNAQYATLRGSAYVSAMSSFVTDLQKYDYAIYQAAQQTNHTFTITRIVPRFAPFRLSDLPDERDLPTVGAPTLPLDSRLSTLDSLKLAVRAVIVPAPPQWIFQPAPVAPARTFHLAWDAAPEASSYAVQLTPDLNQTFSTLTNTAATNLLVNVPASIHWAGLFRVLSVNADGLNTVGAYERIN